MYNQKVPTCCASKTCSKTAESCAGAHNSIMSDSCRCEITPGCKCMPCKCIRCECGDRNYRFPSSKQWGVRVPLVHPRYTAYVQSCALRLNAGELRFALSFRKEIARLDNDQTCIPTFCPWQPSPCLPPSSSTPSICDLFTTFFVCDWCNRNWSLMSDVWYIIFQVFKFLFSSENS